MKKLLLIIIFLLPNNSSAACRSPKDSCFKRVMKTLTLVLGVQAGVQAQFSPKTDVCISQSPYRASRFTGGESEYYNFQPGALRSAFEENGIEIAGEQKDHWVDCFEGNKEPISLINQINYVANAAHKYAPLGEKERAKQAVKHKAPLIFDSLLKPKDSQKITHLFKESMHGDKVKQFFGASSAFEGANTEEELINLAELQQLVAEAAIDTYYSHSDRYTGSKEWISRYLEEKDNDIYFWGNFKKALVEKRCVFPFRHKYKKGALSDNYAAEKADSAQFRVTYERCKND